MTPSTEPASTTITRFQQTVTADPNVFGVPILDMSVESTSGISAGSAGSFTFTNPALVTDEPDTVVEEPNVGGGTIEPSDPSEDSDGIIEVSEDDDDQQGPGDGNDSVVASESSEWG